MVIQIVLYHFWVKLLFEGESDQIVTWHDFVTFKLGQKDHLIVTHSHEIFVWYEGVEDLHTIVEQDQVIEEFPLVPDVLPTQMVQVVKNHLEEAPVQLQLFHVQVVKGHFDARE